MLLLLCSVVSMAGKLWSGPATFLIHCPPRGAALHAVHLLAAAMPMLSFVSVVGQTVQPAAGCVSSQIDIMAPTHSKPVLDEKKRSAKRANRAIASLMKHSIQKLQDGNAMFNDDLVNAVGEGKECKLKGGLDLILDKKKPKGLLKDDRKHSLFQKCEDADCHSDGELVQPIKDDSFF